MIGTSRKRFLQSAVAQGRRPLPDWDGIHAHERDLVTAATSALAATSGAWGVRVHDVARTKSALEMAKRWEEDA